MQCTHRLGRGRCRLFFRGNGPRFFGEIGNISFDDYLLDHAIQSGATIVPSFVQDIDFPEAPMARPVIGWRGGELTADLVVVASGVSTEFVKKLGTHGISYQPPRCVRAFQAELDLGEGNLAKHLGNSIHVFADRHFP